MASNLPDAFLSYTRFDDQYHGGAISAFRDQLSMAVRAITATPFKIFQDVDGIELGENWRERLNVALGEARFFIPILTPSYFQSKTCRDELERFLEFERQSGRNDLILPIYYIDCDILDDPEVRAADRLATELHERERHDWRKLRHNSFKTKVVRTELELLARRVARARRRVVRAATPDDTPAETRIISTNPGTAFRDVQAPWCPEMVVIPPGEFMMGSTQAEREWAVKLGATQESVEGEEPRHLVRIAYLVAVSQCLVTYEQYGEFARTTGREQPRDEGWGRGPRPVINVDWDDAKAFAAWLSVQTCEPYRLLSEAEWEYACRAGTTTRYSWGDEISPVNANYGQTLGKTSEVACYPPNPWGLYDMHGNVWEWVEDCWNENYQNAPDDGRAWTIGDGRRRVLRGGSWLAPPGYLRSANRLRHLTGKRLNYLGFRVARTLSEQPEVNSVEGVHWSKPEYHDPGLTGRVSFNYSNNDGRYSIGHNEFFFETQWSKGSDRSIYLYNDPPSIVGVAEAPGLRSYEDIRDPASYDMSSRVRSIQKGEHAILENRFNKYAVLKITDIKDRTRSNSVDELTFEYWILADTPGPN